MPGDDKRIDRLLDYTKFHVGIYLSIGGGIIALLGSRDQSDYVKALIGSPTWLVIGLVLIVIAGIAGGTIASSCTHIRCFDTFWTKDKTGPFSVPIMTGRWWAYWEHGAFWLGLGCIAYAIGIATSAKKMGPSFSHFL